MHFNFLHLFKKKKNKYDIDNASANQVLQNVFAACDQEPNTIPFDKILLRRKISTRLYDIALFFSGLLLLLTFLSPLAFPPADANVAKVGMNASALHVVSHKIENGYFYLELSGAEIDFDTSYQITGDQIITYGSPMKGNDQIIVFPYLNEEVNIYIYDTSGYEMHLILTPKDPEN